jgi:hypothetical protein
MHQSLLVSETEVESAGVYSLLMDVQDWVALVYLLLDLGQTRILTEKEAKVRLDHSQDATFTVTSRVELVETVF